MLGAHTSARASMPCFGPLVLLSGQHREGVKSGEAWCHSWLNRTRGLFTLVPLPHGALQAVILCFSKRFVPILLLQLQRARS